MTDELLSRLRAVAVSAGLFEELDTSARAHFGVGRAYRAAGRETDALAEFREAVRLDPSLTAAKDAIASARLKY